MGKKSQRVGNEFQKECERMLRRVADCVDSWDDAQIPASLRPADLQATIFMEEKKNDDKRTRDNLQ